MSPFEPSPIKHFAVAVSGVVDKAVKSNAPGRIRYGNTTWFARPYPNTSNLTFAAGDQVLILARQGNTLLIVPGVNHHKGLTMQSNG